MSARLERIRAIARDNAREGLDQGKVADYLDNMRDTIAGLFPDWTPAEAAEAEAIFREITGDYYNV